VPWHVVAEDVAIACEDLIGHLDRPTADGVSRPDEAHHWYASAEAQQSGLVRSWHSHMELVPEMVDVEAQAL
jgi:hypothetical protein